MNSLICPVRIKDILFTGILCSLLLFLSSGCGKSPTDPTDLTVQVISATEIQLQWIKSHDDDSEKLFYKVFRNEESIFGTFETTAIDSGLRPVTEYCYTVEAFDLGLLHSNKTNEACATTLPDIEAPSVPQNLVARTVTSLQIDLTWDASTDNDGVTGYNVFRDEEFLQSVDINFLSDTGLLPSTEYCYEITAFDESGNESSQSDELCVTTGAQ
jgi:chitodextrinase